VRFTREFEHSQELFDAAIAEFVAKGYAVASINTILEMAGMSKGQFYYHFKNKEGLYFALIEVLIAQKREFLAGVMTPTDFQQDLFGIFQTQIRYGLAFARDYPAIQRFSESFLREKENAIYAKAIAQFNFEDDTALNGLIARAYANGELRTELPLAFVQKIIAYLFSHVIELVDLKRGEDAEANLTHLMTFMKFGLARSADS